MSEELIEDNFKNTLITAQRYVSNLTTKEIDPAVINSIPRDIVQKYHILPFRLEDKVLSIATDSPAVVTDKSFIESKLGYTLRIHWADTDNIQAALNQFYEIANINRTSTGQDVSTADGGVLNEIYNLIRHAIQLKATDIHILPSVDQIYIFYRINGHLEDYTEEYNKIFSANQADQIVNVVKGMDTSGQAKAGTKTMPNSGSWERMYDGIVYDFRLATVPEGSVSEQKISLRILPQKNETIKLESLGYSEADRKLIETTLFNSATGLFIMSGPTGSGKTTALYAQMFYLYDKADGPLNVMTIDDPIEIKVPVFTQVQVKRAALESVDLSPQKILEAFLRSDPDIILYNEIRSKEDGNVALMASTTGHRVFTTLHASDAIKTLTRFIDLGVSKTTLLSELKLVVAQRLVAKLCPLCSQRHIITDTEKAALTDKEIELLNASDIRERAGKSRYINCSCNHGYIGRTVIPEIIVFDDEFKDVLLHESGYAKLLAYLRQKGFRTMWEKGLDLVRSGDIELTELINVIGSNKVQSLKQ